MNYPEHPLITGIDTLTEEQLTSKIAELHKKLNIAYRTGNGHLCNQIRLALASYQSMYTEKVRKDTDSPFSNVIDIS
jgi:hypothetical protein